MSDERQPDAAEVSGSVYSSLCGRWVAINDYGDVGRVVIYSIGDSPRPPVANLTVPLRGIADIPWLAWSHRSQRLAVSTRDELWFWHPDTGFQDAGQWSWSGPDVQMFGGLKWSSADDWLLRYVRYAPRSGRRMIGVWRFECFDLTTHRLVAARESFAEITTAEWLDDEPVFAINVIIDQAQSVYQTVHVDAASGETIWKGPV